MNVKKTMEVVLTNVPTMLEVFCAVAIRDLF